MTTPAGWFPDPHGQADLRYWDGAAWTDDTREAELGATAEPAGAGTTSRPSLGARIGVGVALVAVVGIGGWFFGRGDSSDDVSSTPLATAPQALPGPTAAPLSSVPSSTTTAPIQALDLGVIEETRAEDVIELVYVGCGASGIRSATSLGDGRFVTDFDVAEAGWLIEARGLPGFGGDVGPVQVIGVTTDGLTIIGSEGASEAVESAPVPTVGQELAIVGTLQAGELRASLLGTVSEVEGRMIRVSTTNPTGDAVLGAGAFDHASRLVGVVSGRSADQLDITLSPADAPDTTDPGCGDDTNRLPVGGVELTDPILLSYALAQRLADALADDDWPLVRQLEPARAGHSDQQFVDGWGTLERSTLIPVGVTDRNDGSRRHRLLLVAWETDAPATQVTRPFCVTWDVNLEAGTVRQTGIDSVPLEIQPGWVDPGTLRGEAAARC